MKRELPFALGMLYKSKPSVISPGVIGVIFLWENYGLRRKIADCAKTVEICHYFT